MDRYNELVELINKANYEYHVLDNPTTLTDQEYDNYLREIYKFEEENPDVIREDSPTKKIGGVILDKFDKSYNDSQIIVSDPYTGTIRYFDKELFKSRYNYLGKRALYY